MTKIQQSTNGAWMDINWFALCAYDADSYTSDESVWDDYEKLGLPEEWLVEPSSFRIQEHFTYEKAAIHLFHILAEPQAVCSLREFNITKSEALLSSLNQMMFLLADKFYNVFTEEHSNDSKYIKKFNELFVNTVISIKSFIDTAYYWEVINEQWAKVGSSDTEGLYDINWAPCGEQQSRMLVNLDQHVIMAKFLAELDELIVYEERIIELALVESKYPNLYSTELDYTDYSEHHSSILTGVDCAFWRTDPLLREHWRGEDSQEAKTGKEACRGGPEFTKLYHSQYNFHSTEDTLTVEMLKALVITEEDRIAEEQEFIESSKNELLRFFNNVTDRLQEDPSLNKFTDKVLSDKRERIVLDCELYEQSPEPILAYYAELSKQFKTHQLK